MKPADRFAVYHERISKLDRDLHCFLHLRMDDAKREADAAEARARQGRRLSAIDGWCIGVKANIAVAGLPHHAGIAAYRDFIASDDATVVRRLKDAGAVILGVVNMHEGALGATTDNSVFGRTFNPWGNGLTPGGSSGGSGAAVAAGLCDVALGSDTMGSVRIPSAYCGVQGMKPSPGLVPSDGVLPLSPSLDHVGVHARSSRDLMKTLEVMTGRPVFESPLQIEDLRFGAWDGHGQIARDPDVAHAFGEVVGHLTASAADVRRVEPPVYVPGVTRRAGLLVAEVEAHAVHAARLRDDPEGFSEAFRKLLMWGAEQPPERVERARKHIAEVEESAHKAFEGLDAIIAPTAPQPAFPFTAPVPENQADFTAWANIAGLPAVAVFSGLSASGLPVSVQLIGRRDDDGRLLRMAAAVEALLGQPPLPPGFEGVLPGN